jgi:hypothetical protein
MVTSPARLGPENDCGQKHAKDKDSELGLGAQKNTRGQPVKN